MRNIIGKGITTKFYFNFSWGYFYFSAGNLLYKKLYNPLSDELNKLKSILYRIPLYV